MIDSHCHLDLPHFEDDFEDTVARAVREGVTALMNIGYDEASARATAGFVERFPFFFGVVGTHPHDASAHSDAHEAELRRLLAHPRIVGVGEIGLDFYRDHSPRDRQREIFRRMLRLARETAKPVVIHCRDAFEEVLEVLREEGPAHRGIFHAFSGDEEAARRVIDLGFHLGIGGVATFANANLRRTLEALPLDRIVLETDSPYLTPHPYRGNRNEPGYVTLVAQAVAEANRTTLGDIARVTNENFCRAMGVEPEAWPRPVYKIGGSVYIHVASADPGDLLGIDGVDELVMCGPGEPLADVERVVAAARAGKERGWRVRLDTVGQGNAIAGRDVAAELAGVVDEVVVLMYGTAPAAAERAASDWGRDARFETAREFVRDAVRAGLETVCEFVAAPRFDVEQCRELAKALGAKYDIRMYRS
jgi:TatD DNase family protein